MTHDHDPHHDHDHAGHDHGHGHAHHGHAHGHHGHSHAPTDFGRAFAIGIALNGAYVVGEAVYGVFANSLALLADAGHNAGDVISLALAWLAAWLSNRAPSRRYTYGLRSSSILAALANAVLLALVTGGIAWEAVLRLMQPQASAGITMMGVAAVGILINGATALMFMSGRDRDLNIKSAFQHMASDALVALGVVVGGGLILFTHWLWLDPVISLAISAVIVFGTWSLLREALALALAGVPAGIDRGGVAAYLEALPGVTEVHDLHIWGMSTTETALTAHLVRPDAGVDDALLAEVCEQLKRRFAIQHATLQVERGEHPCELADHAAA
ncbi:MAG TPA: cation diffusion facilitator family transporter [Caulobacteraceae bacterium]|jgi:cobalt-zinc-cadmium efflux system protein|nr:cation diffusion facilitator family transporter [Caulobacteraceae bacterium]